MSKRSSKRKEPGRSTIRSSREHARAVAPRASAPDVFVARAYPTAAELFAQGSAWRDYVSEALRSLLAPAALAGAVGLAGCAGAGDARGVAAGDTTTTQSSATLTPMGPPTVVMSPLAPVPPVHPPQADGGGRQVAPIQPSPDPTSLGGEPPMVQPAPTPQPRPRTRRHPRPTPHPMAIAGGMGVILPGAITDER